MQITQEELATEVGKSVKQAREQRERSARSVALAIGMDPANYHRLEAGTVLPSVHTLMKVAEELSKEKGPPLTLDELVGRK